MKKIVAVFLAFMIAALFVACGDNDNGETTLPNMLLTNVPSLSSTPTQPNVTAENVSANTNGNASHTMVLTTQQGMAMPTVVTTAFTPDPVVAAQNNSTATDFNLTIPSNMTPPVVSYSTQTTARTTTTKKTTTSQSEEPEEEVTEKKQPTAKVIDEQGCNTLSNHQCEITFSPDGWGSGIKSNSRTIQVYHSNGESKSVTARVAGKDADGNYRIIIDTSEFEVGTISFTLPTQFVESKDGLSYSEEKSMSANLYWDEVDE
ncbi:MAG: hypothetical protein NC122_05145 [Faecalibacterium sp.]|nr:hypothetical protein [Ruminococcus sp.]MCM1391997.1 hypothetical protein [Ruminococcus sp.]MCM1485572.1 hypothetical protein [Faecalibacterium sp.]